MFQEDLQMANKYIYCIYFTVYFLLSYSTLCYCFCFGHIMWHVRILVSQSGDPNLCVFCLNHWATGKAILCAIVIHICHLSHQNLAPWCPNGKESTCNAGDPGSILGSGRSMEKGMATHSSILAWRILWTAGYSSWGCKESNTTEATLHACTHDSIRMSYPSLYHTMTNVKPIPPHQNLTESYFLSRVSWPEEKESSYPGPSLLNLKLAFRKHRMGTSLLWNGFIVPG